MARLRVLRTLGAIDGAYLIGETEPELLTLVGGVWSERPSRVGGEAESSTSSSRGSEVDVMGVMLPALLVGFSLSSGSVVV